MSKLDQEFFWVCISVLVLSANPQLVAAVVIAENRELSFLDRNTFYNYILASPISKYPHGALSEDGYYKVAVNDTSVWFQLCEDMIFNHDPPHCYGCQDCGCPSQCGTKCSALVATEEGGYPVCKTIGHATHTVISLIDEKYPQKGITVKMYASGHKRSCSLSVSVLCDSKEAQVPSSLQLLGDCDYVTELRHPSGCSKTISSNGSGLGWFGTLLTIVLCSWRLSGCWNYI